MGDVMNQIVVGIGELLWDVFPQGKRMGGAPVNFACHCGQLGAEAYPVSCIGRDNLGDELRGRLTDLNVDQSYIAEDATHPTGTVQVTLDAHAKPSYEICEGVAWDMIRMTPALDALAPQADAVCFGSLCQRHTVSYETIHAFLSGMRAEALKIFDVNLRQAFYSKAIIEASLGHANVLKLSDEELPVLAELFGVSGAVEAQLHGLLARFDLNLIAYTRGPDGSLLVGPDETAEHPGCPGKAIDSVGAGDSFTAALCVGLLTGRPLAAINDHANRVATFVCSHEGAVPAFPQALKDA
ncbi:MAG: carbohydrate kinase [Verrucomicrobia bacterium]|jgi:fructokinase|nr:carbohydrate kinase [Verrucomicrobiota bacterium]